MIDLMKLFGGAGQSFPFGAPGAQMQLPGPAGAPPPTPGSWGTPPVPGAPQPLTSAPMPPSPPLPPPSPIAGPQMPPGMLDAPPGAGDPNAMTPAFGPGGPSPEMQGPPIPPGLMAGPAPEGPPMPPGLQANAVAGTEQMGPNASEAAKPSMMDKLMGSKEFGAQVAGIGKAMDGGDFQMSASTPMSAGTGNDQARSSAAELFKSILAAKQPRRGGM